MKREIQASLIVVVAVFLITFVAGVIDIGGGEYQGVVLSAAIAGVAALVAIAVLLVWGLPAHFLLKKFGHSNVSWYVLVAIIPGFLFIYIFKPFGDDTHSDLLTQALFCSLCGVVGAVVFWFIAVYRPGLTQR